MKAVVVRAFGGVDHLAVEEVEPPHPKPGELTIDVAFAGVGFVDTLMRSGAFAFVPLPLTPGIEVSGTVRAIGQGVAGFHIGQRVAALLTDFTDGGTGGYAEVARAKAALTVRLEDMDDLATAAATAVNGATAFLAMEGVASDAAVAISGASGGLGQCLVAAAKYADARQIIAVSNQASRASDLSRLGATEIVSTDSFEQDDTLIDAAFDTVGGDMRLKLLRRLRNAGRLALLGNASGKDMALPGDDLWLRSIRVEGLATGGLSAMIPQRIAAAAQAAIVHARAHPPAFAVLDLAQAADAHRMLEHREGPGKLVLKLA